MFNPEDGAIDSVSMMLFHGNSLTQLDRMAEKFA